MNYDNRYFKAVSNSKTGEVNQETIFHYRQEGNNVWATYKGGQIVLGTLVAKMNQSGSLDMRYSHVNVNGDLMTGKCRSKPEKLKDGRLRLHETWQWTTGDCSKGISVVEEFLP